MKLLQDRHAIVAEEAVACSILEEWENSGGKQMLEAIAAAVPGGLP